MSVREENFGYKGEEIIKQVLNNYYVTKEEIDGELFEFLSDDELILQNLGREFINSLFSYYGNEIFENIEMNLDRD